MQILSNEYLLLFNTLTETAETLERLRASLLAAQSRAEELFLQREEPEEEDRRAVS